MNDFLGRAVYTIPETLKGKESLVTLFLENEGKEVGACSFKFKYLS